MVTARVKYTGGPPPPNDLHIDVQRDDGGWTAITGYSTIPKGMDPVAGIDIRFSTGNPNVGGPGKKRFRVRWTIDKRNIGSDYLHYTIGPDIFKFEPSTKETVKKVMVYTVIFGLFVQWLPFINGVVLLVIVVANEIASAAMSGQAEDSKYALAAVPPKIGLPAAATHVKWLSKQLNSQLNDALNAQLDWCAVIHTVCVSTNRFYSALRAGDQKVAASRLKDVSTHFGIARELQAKASMALEEVAFKIAESDVELVVQPYQVHSFQEGILRDGAFPPTLDRGFRNMFAKLDVNLVSLFDPHDIVRRFALGTTVTEPYSLSDVLLAEAKAMSQIDRMIGPFPGIHELIPKKERRGTAPKQPKKNRPRKSLNK
jgi:hypothetical protein